jgi:hypothetical protein
MIQGGRGGAVRLKLYLSTVLLGGSVNSHALYGANAVFNVSGASWARCLALPDPDGRGARRVADAQGWLHDHRFLDVERRPGSEPVVRLLSPDGAGRPWSRPTTPYITIPLSIWTKHWIWALGARELAVLIALLDLQGGRGGTSAAPAPQWMTTEQRSRYGFSPDTWRHATAALQDSGILAVDDEVVAMDFETARRRKTYWVDPDRLDDFDPFEEAAVA